jgi:hypothetical protein
MNSRGGDLGVNRTGFSYSWAKPSSPALMALNLLEAA